MQLITDVLTYGHSTSTMGGGREREGQKTEGKQEEGKWEEKRGHSINMGQAQAFTLCDPIKL